MSDPLAVVALDRPACMALLRVIEPFLRQHLADHDAGRVHGTEDCEAAMELAPLAMALRMALAQDEAPADRSAVVH